MPMINSFVIALCAISLFVITFYVAIKKSERIGRLSEQGKAIERTKRAKVSRDKYNTDVGFADRVRDKFKR